MTSLIDVFEPGQRIFVGAASNEPVGVLQALKSLDLPADLRFIQFPIGAMNRTDFTALNATASVETFFMTPTLAKAADPGRVHFLPMQMRWVYDYLATNLDVAIVQIARDREGVLRLGPNTDFVEAAMHAAKAVVGELNLSITAPAGCPRVEPGQFACIVETEHDLPEMPQPDIDDAAATIGRLVADLIDDGACIQTGIGAIPAAILKELKDKNDLGMHGGLIDDGGMALIEAGNMTGQAKEMDRGLHVTGIGMGTQALYAWLAERQDVVFRGADHTHEAGAIRQLSNFVSINSAVEIDLFGQINAEFAGGRQISGTGGSVDFMRAAKSSKGGRSIVAMNATARGGTVSRIVKKVELVTALRTDVDTVVTEFGVAEIKNLAGQDRVDALIEIAAPEFRDALRD